MSSNLTPAAFINRSILGAGLVALLVGGAASGAGSTGTVTRDGWAGVKLRMTPSQMQQVLGAPIVPAAAKNGSHCRMARLAIGPARGYALFEQGRLSALFFTAGVKTDRGIGIGSTSEALEKAYGSSRLLFAPAGNSLGIHVYTRKRYLRDGTALRFDLDPPHNDRVTQLGYGGHALSISSGRC